MTGRYKDQSITEYKIIERVLNMKLNLDKQFLDLKGYPLQIKLDDTLANMLAMATTGPPAKMITWAVNLANEGEIEIDKSDVKFLIDFIERHPGITNLVKAQLLEGIEKLENVQPKKIEVDHDSTEDIARDLMRQVNKLV